MQLNSALARQIADKANQVLKRDLLVADLSGQILAGIPTQSFVSEALSAAQTGRSTTSDFNDRQTKWWPFVYDERTVAVFGLPLDTGPITQEAITLLQGLAEVIVYQHFLLDKIQSAERVRADFLRQTPHRSQYRTSGHSSSGRHSSAQSARCPGCHPYPSRRI